MSYNLPNPSLIGILLAVSTHNGPQIAFSYPEDLCTRKVSTGDDEVRSEDDDIDDEDYEADHDAGGDAQKSVWDAGHPDYYLGTKLDLMTFLDARDTHRSSRPGGVSSATDAASPLETARDADPGENREKSDVSVKTQAARSSRILGFEPEQLSEMLCPPRAMCNRRFDVMLENVVFLGLPVHVGSNGSWRSKKHQHVPTGTVKSEQGKEEDGAGDIRDPDSRAGTAMSMFHLVFIMRPPDIERNYRVDEMFYNVTSKLSLVLRYEQQRHDFVWAQVRQISKIKEELRTATEPMRGPVSEHLVANNALCKMMVDCYKSISASRIANLNINNKVRSFQIPIKMEFHSLPEPTVPYLPGSCLSSTINCLGSSGLVNIGETSRYNNTNLMGLLLGMAGQTEGEENADDDDMSSHPDDIVYLALLLWDEPDVIIRDIKAEPNSAIARFVRMISPTESLLKIANNLRLSSESTQLSIAEIKSFALHLVYWRRARVIPPLNTRAIYIVSPMAPIATNFHRDIVKFNQQFPTVPSLPSFLKLLSTRSRKPRQFASIIPSKDHKEMYLLALAWLVRFGYVTQLHTYIWLKVSKKVKMKVEEELEEELGKAPAKRSDDTKKPRAVSKSHLAVDNSSKQTETASNEPSSFTMDEEIEKLQRKYESSAIPELILEDDGDTILVDPGRASSLERKWINKIIHDECGLSAELTAVFYKLLKYMNGKNSLELLLLRENVARTELRKLLSEIDEYIISVRHW